MIPLTVLFGLLTISVLVLLMMRVKAARSENDTIHVGDRVYEEQQALVAGRLEKIDHWGKILTVVTVAFGFCLLCVHLYNVWMQGQTIR